MPGEARNYAWEPFRKGNQISVRHGAFSKARMEPIAQELAAGLVVDRPDLAHFPEAVMAWASACASWLTLEEHLAEHGMFDEHGKLRAGPVEWARRFRRDVVDLGARLGLDPRSYAELARDRANATRTAFDLDRLRERGRQALSGDHPTPPKEDEAHE